MRAGISFRRAPNIWRKGTRYSLSSSSADTEGNENAPFCHVLCCRPALSRASIKLKKQRGQGDYPVSFHHLSYSQRKRSFEIFTTEEGWPGLRRSAFSSWLCHRLPLWASVLHPPTPGCEMGTASLLSLEGTHHSMYGKQGWLAILKLRYLTGYKQKILRMKAKAKLAGCPGQSRQTTRSPWAGIAHTQPSPSRTGFLTICISLSS